MEILAEGGTYTQEQMAKVLRVNQSTISRELKHGRKPQMNSERIFYDTYLADVYRENRKNSRAKDPRQYSNNFFDELAQAIISTDDNPRRILHYKSPAEKFYNEQIRRNTD